MGASATLVKRLTSGFSVRLSEPVGAYDAGEIVHVGSGEWKSLRELSAPVSVELNDIVSTALAGDQINWCRARLLHALAAAAKQGVLAEVVQELLPHDGDTIMERLIESLTETGWIRRPA
jgi:hypothetical protein